jgi:large subunit ribosomal protein L9
MAGHVEVILTENIKDLGKLGERKRVKAGYARNWLIPANKALYITADNLVKFEAIKKRELKRLAKERADFEAIAATVNGKVVEVTAKTHDEGKLYGSVTPADVIKDLQEKHEITIDRKYLVMDDHMKQVGEYTIAVNFHEEVSAEIKLIIKSQEQ